MTKKEKIFVVMIGFVLIIIGQWFILGGTSEVEIWEKLIFNLIFFVLMPVLTIKYIFKENLEQYFITTKFEKRGGILLVVYSILFFGLLGFFMVKSGWWINLPVSGWLLNGNIGLVLFINILLMPIILLANEIFFRGLVLSSLIKWLGIAGAILAQALISTFYVNFFIESFQIEKIVFFLLLNIFLGYVVLLKKTVLISAIIYWVVYVGVDLVVFYKFL